MVKTMYEDEDRCEKCGLYLNEFDDELELDDEEQEDVDYYKSMLSHRWCDSCYLEHAEKAQGLGTI